MAAAETFPEEVFRHRNELHLTQQQLAERAGVHRATIRAAERGDSVSPATAVRVLSALDEFGRERVSVEQGEVAACPEFAAIRQMVSVLEILGTGERRRALAYLNDRFGGAS